MRMVNHLILIVSLSILGISCAGTNEGAAAWKQVSVENLFSWEMPATFKEVPVQGIDSRVGRFQSASLTLGFDYGWYSNRFDEPSLLDLRVEAAVIDRREARIVQFAYKSEGRKFYCAGVHFPKVNEDGRTRLSMTMKSETAIDYDLAKRIFMSIRFP